jgi:putative lipoprotein
VVAPAAAQTAGPQTAAPLAYRLPGHSLSLHGGPAEPLPGRTAPSPARADSLRPPDNWLGHDKVLHFSASFLLTLSGQYVLTDKGGLSDGDALPLSAGAALGLGLAKEVADSRRAVGPHFSLRDLAVDALGVALGALVTRL